MKIAAIQTLAGADITQNLERASALIGEAVTNENPRLVALPEYFCYYGPEATWIEVAQQGEKVLATIAECARRYKIFLLAGTILFPSDTPGKAVNESVLLGPDGTEIVRYRKKYLFDVETPDRSYRESDFLLAGTELATADIDSWQLGLSICFDLRFPTHYQQLRTKGIDLIAAPSAFTATTGAAHWDVTIRARAIETQCYVIAPGLFGTTDDGKTGYGHTAIIDPWGTVIANMTDGEGFVTADIDHDFLEDVRQRMPLHSVI